MGFVKRFESNPSIWPVTNEIKHRVPVGLLTNMYTDMFKAIQKRGILPRIQWDVVVDSSIEGCQKPDSKIFDIAQLKAGIPGDQILFVDNSPEHVQAAQAFGWQGFWYDSSSPQSASQNLLEFFKKHEPRP